MLYRSKTLKVLNVANNKYRFAHNNISNIISVVTISRSQNKIGGGRQGPQSPLDLIYN